MTLCILICHFALASDDHFKHRTTSTCQQDDYIALRALYLSTDGDNWKSQTDGNAEWPSESDFIANPTSPPSGFTDLEQWQGVGLDNAGCVDYLSLSNNNLIGNIPTQIGNLTNLTTLSLSSNDLSGAIPIEIGNLINLTYLVISNNDLTGSIPPEIGDLDNLITLASSRNQLTGSIPPEIGNLENLTSLDMSSNSFAGSIPPEIGNLTNLLYLYLHNNDLSGDIPTEIGNLTSLLSLHLYFNNLTGSIPPDIGDLISLTNLRIYGNQLTGSIPPEIGNLINLTFLGIGSNELTGSIPPEIGNLGNLVTLTSGSNQLSGSIPTQIGDLVSLTTLSFSYNELTGTIPSEIGNLINLDKLYLHSNEISGIIPPEIGNLINLDRLDFSNNDLSGCIPEELGNLINLTSMGLLGNQLDGPFPSAFSNLVNLSTLLLSSNNLSGCYDPILSSFCTQIPTLSNSQISNSNNFDAPWEDFCNNSVGACSSSQRFADSSNGCHLQDWEALKAIYESTNGANWNDNGGWANQFTNQNLPPIDCNLADLIGVTLDNNGRVSEIELSNNQLSGSLPPQIINLDKLTTLNLSNNQLTGCYPEVLNELCDQFSNSDISLGNNFNANWGNFCNTGSGACTYPSSCLNFSGSDNRLVASSQILNDIESCNFTFEAWVELDPSNNGIVPIISNRKGPLLSEITGALFSINNSGELHMGMSDGPGNYTSYAIDDNGTFGASLKDGVCHHVALSRNESIVEFYIDGDLIGTQNLTNFNTLTSPLPMQLAYDVFSGVALEGHLSDVKMWASHRTIDQIARDMWETTPYDDEFLRAYWRLNEGGGQIAYDYSGNNRFATLGVSASSDNADPQFGNTCCNDNETNDCEINIYHDENENLNTDDFTAASKIQSRATVNDVDYTAGNFISLDPGFNTNANFLADIDDGCYQDDRILFLDEPENNSIEIDNTVIFEWDIILSNLNNYSSTINYSLKLLEAIVGTSIDNSINSNIVIVDQSFQLSANDNQEIIISSQQFQAGKNYIWQVSFTHNNNVIESEWYNFAYKTTPADFGGALCSTCDHDELFNGIDVKPEHERFPPIANSISFQVLNELTECAENLLLIADFTNHPSIDTYHAIRINGEKFVLRDDGLGADEIAGDGLFSIFLVENIEALQEEFDSRNAELIGGSRVAFNNRSLIDFSTARNAMMGPYGGTSDIGCGDLIVLDTIIPDGPVGLLDHNKSLLITDLSIVEDFTRIFNPCTGQGNPNGVWTFGYLMRQMASDGPGNIASDAEASAFAIDWLETWVVNNTVNGESVGQRLQMQNLIDDWLQTSNTAGAPQGQVKMELAPFRLTAIVNRVDLRGNIRFETQNDGITEFNGGEGRFVFCALNSTCGPREFNVIFEFGIHKTSCAAYLDYAQEWADLNNFNFGDPAFNIALENITRQFTDAGSNPTKPNQSSINQVRTNENALSNPWELREFNLLSSGQLGIVPVKMEPAVKFIAQINNSDVQLLIDFINNQEPPVRNNDYKVPEKFQGQDFLGGHALIPFPPTGQTPHHWDGITPQSSPETFIIDDADRHVFSLNTCSACHGGETQTFFTHVDPTGFGTQAGLSGFLTGTAGRGGALDADGDMANGIMTVNDPAGRPNTNNLRQARFNDLLRREADLNDLIRMDCAPLTTLGILNAVSFRPLAAPH